MIDTLYDCFKHWTKSGSLFIFSDPHFEDSDCKLMNPNWITPQEQVNIINKFVHKSDTLILLGDVGNVEWIKKLKAGYKVLITGNHDAGAENYKRLEEYYLLNGEDYKECKIKYKNFVSIEDMGFNRYAYCDNRLFDEVYTGPLIISDKIILSHEPICGINWALNIHGHEHNGTRYSIDGKDPYHYSVCADVIDYTPVDLKGIIKGGALKQIDSIHRITIDRATKNSMRKDK